jgi:hypothetical protein
LLVLKWKYVEILKILCKRKAVSVFLILYFGRNLLSFEENEVILIIYCFHVILNVLYSFWARFPLRFIRYCILRHEAMKTQDLFIYLCNTRNSIFGLLPNIFHSFLCLLIAFFILYKNPCSCKISYVWGTGLLNYSQYWIKKFFVRYLYYSIILNDPTCFRPHGTSIKEWNLHNTPKHQSRHFCTQLTWYERDRWLKM